MADLQKLVEELSKLTVTDVENWLAELRQSVGVRSCQLALKRLRQALSLVAARPELFTEPEPEPAPVKPTAKATTKPATAKPGAKDG